MVMGLNWSKMKTFICWSSVPLYVARPISRLHTSSGYNCKQLSWQMLNVWWPFIQLLPLSCFCSLSWIPRNLNAEVQVIPNGMGTTFVYISTELSYLTFIRRFNENCAKFYRNSVNFSMKSWTVDQVTVNARVEAIMRNAQKKWTIGGEPSFISRKLTVVKPWPNRVPSSRKFWIVNMLTNILELRVLFILQNFMIMMRN